MFSLSTSLVFCFGRRKLYHLTLFIEALHLLYEFKEGKTVKEPVDNSRLDRQSPKKELGVR